MKILIFLGLKVSEIGTGFLIAYFWVKWWGNPLNLLPYTTAAIVATILGIVSILFFVFIVIPCNWQEAGEILNKRRGRKGIAISIKELAEIVKKGQSYWRKK